ncbi:MAG: hypothetical protein KDJ52_18670 [Anaerolineae bacterium]|nr:hypothetical protein [Anaerolineae bacterium]
MGDTIYLAAAYGVFWLVSFVFIYSIVSRQRHLQNDVAMLEQLAQEESMSE